MSVLEQRYKDSFDEAIENIEKLSMKVKNLTDRVTDYSKSCVLKVCDKSYSTIMSPARRLENYLKSNGYRVADAYEALVSAIDKAFNTFKRKVDEGFDWRRDAFKFVVDAARVAAIMCISAGQKVVNALLEAWNSREGNVAKRFVGGASAGAMIGAMGGPAGAGIGSLIGGVVGSVIEILTPSPS